MTATVTRPAPGSNPARTGVVPDRRLALERAIRTALAAGVFVQVLQRLLHSGAALSEYGRSLWYVTYEQGFVRRGLAGELLRRVLGDTPSLRAVDAAQNALAFVMFAVTVWLVVLLCRRRTVLAYAVAALLVVAPFGFDSLGGQRRPDLIGFALLGVAGAWAALRPPRPLVFAAVCGLLLGVCSLVSEVDPLIVGPWLALVVAALARSQGSSPRRSAWAMVVASAPSVVVLGALAAVGRPSDATVAALERAAPPEIGGHGSIFVYLADTFRGSLNRVVAGPTRLAMSVVVGALLVALVLWCLRALLPYARSTFEWTVPSALLRRAWWAGMAVAAVLLFALGLDWLRWVTSFGFAAMLAAAGIVLLTSRSPTRRGALAARRRRRPQLARSPVVVRPPGSQRWQRPIPSYPTLSLGAACTAGVGLYLLLLPPLPNWVRDAGSAARLLLDVPR